VNLAVNKCLYVPEVSALLAKCRKLVYVFKSSALKRTSLQDAADELEIKKFCKIFMMIKLVVIVRMVFKLLSACHLESII